MKPAVGAPKLPTLWTLLLASGSQPLLWLPSPLLGPLPLPGVLLSLLHSINTPIPQLHRQLSCHGIALN